jgi:Domain of unknown function (DUF4249)
MLKVVPGLPVCLILIIALGRCIDPYAPHLDSYQKLLVVEGLITNEKIPFEVRLTRTFQSIDSVPEVVDDAIVYITDDEGNMSNLDPSGNGIYKTDSSTFKGEPGKTYILHIQTPDGHKYESEPCIMMPVAGIDSVYFTKDEVTDNINNKTTTGLRIYLNSGEPPDGNKYFRWEYEETWKFKLLFPKRYNYVNETIIIKLDNVKEYCWKSNKSTEIITGSVSNGQKSSINQQPVLFIPSDQSDRLTVQYSLLVKQYSISEKEFDFWTNLNQVNQSGGKIFDKQPYSVISNICNIDNADEKVLGYFRVSAVKTKRIVIIPDYLLDMNLPGFHYNCPEYVVNPLTYVQPLPPPPWVTPPTFDEIYEMFMHDGGFKFVEPVYNDTTKELTNLIFAPNDCSDCTLTGSIIKPDFWTDLP